ncbi:MULTISPECIES: glycosyltransferase family 4 protein [unclassified Luteococcus]|uniref:glycosyltransferase family 4 protein n=1 Tax=unclassified Luteococcus TaxID=2639923 RepID=UPI00313D0A70
MRLGLLTQWYDPEPGPAALPGTLARGLRERGHEVHVLTGFPNYPTGQVAEGYRIRPWQREELDGVRVTRVPLFPSHKASAASRMLTYGSFGATAATLGLPSLRGLDALWVNYSPVTLAPAMLLATKALRVPSVCHVADLWPDTLAASGVDESSAVGRWAMKGSGAAADAMYRAASFVSYISPGVHQALRDRGVPEGKLAYTPMWANEDLFRPGAEPMRAELGLGADQTVLIYAGSIGEAQGLQTLVEACGLVDDPRFVCLIAGSGTSEQTLKDRASQLPRRNVRFLGRIAPERMSNLLATADAAYIGLNEHPLAQMTMPSKTQATLGAGCPLLVAGRGDVAQVARDSQAGWTVPSGDARALAAAIREMCATERETLTDLGHQARRYYEETFAVRAGVDRLEKLLVAAASGRKNQ